ncbi:MULTISPECIES: hypothetical protein [Haloferax]|uniref:Uncharacterized protein n=1 Tax=Haloferax marinum TaxID=2666143 RepID=A0A6A8G8Z0_9EURY|nr:MULTISPECIES: hypothetical protein [Haloferax]KAB1198610.1 hypothetical protein Hfx1150_14235 [Haloferax sp. CBA1150]MRW97720.1 hypothetical protein [Haloferax marinum]
MNNPVDLSEAEIPQNIDQTRIQIVEHETGEKIDRFVGTQPPIPEQGDFLQVGWWDSENGDVSEDHAGPFRVMDRSYYYIERRDYDENEEGLITLVTISVVPA